MHSGRVRTLGDAIEFYDDLEGPNLDPLAEDMDVDGDDEDDIEAFLRALTDDEIERQIPQTVPSGLTPGGDIGS